MYKIKFLICFTGTVWEGIFIYLFFDFPGGSDGKASAYNAGDLGLIPGIGRSPGEGNGNPLQYSCLENPMDGGTWQATVHGVTKSRTRLSDIYFTLLCFLTFQSKLFTDNSVCICKRGARQFESNVYCLSNRVTNVRNLSPLLFAHHIINTCASVHI